MGVWGQAGTEGRTSKACRDVEAAEEERVTVQGGLGQCSSRHTVSLSIACRHTYLPRQQPWAVGPTHPNAVAHTPTHNPISTHAPHAVC